MALLGVGIEKLFEEKFFDKQSGQCKNVALMVCAAISEDELHVSQASLLRQWRLEYMSLKGEET